MYYLYYRTNTRYNRDILDAQEGIKTEHALTKAVEGYFQAHFEGLHRYAYTLLNDNDEAKDAVQAVFLKFWEKRAEIDEQQSPKTYLYVSIYHYCLNIKRHRKVIQIHATQQTHPQVEPADPLIEKQTHQQLTGLIDSLPPRCKLVFTKSRIEQKKYAEIAKELDISIKTVEVQMGKALKILRKALFETTSQA